MQPYLDAMPAPASAERVAGTTQAMVLIVANVLPTMGIVSLIPVIPQLFAQFHAEPNAEFWVPAIVTVPSVCIALCSPIAGAVADRIGRRTLFLAALCIYAVVGCAPLFLDSLRAILASRILLGVTEAVIYTTVNTLMGDYFRGDERKKWLAYQNAIGSLLATGLIVLGGLLGSISWRGPFALYALAIPIFLAAWVLTWEPQPQAADKEESAVGGGGKFPWTAMALVISVTLLSSIIFFIEPLQLGLVMNAIGASSPALIGVVAATTGFALPLGAYLLGRIKNMRVGYLLALAYALFGCGFLGLGASRTLTGIVIGACIAQFACGVTFPLLITWCQSKLEYGVRARGMGMWISTFFIGQFLSTSSVSFLSKPAGGIAGVVLWFAALCTVAAPAAFIGEFVLRRANRALN